MPGTCGNILDTIGNTPVVKLSKLSPGGGAMILAKLEKFNPTGSIKDRIALAMIESAERDGRIAPGTTIVEPTSGNTGIGLALVCAVKGYRLILTMPENMTEERRAMLRSYGAELVLTPAGKWLTGAIEEARSLAAKPGFYMPDQFTNPANPRIHRETTAMEIIEQTGGAIDAFVAGVGTGGTITGIGQALREKLENVRIVAVEPAGSPVLSGGKPGGPHMIQGIGAGFIPEVLDRKVMDAVIRVSDEEAFAATRRLAREEGVYAGISSGAACLAAIRTAADMDPGSNVLVILPDNGDRYLSTGVFSEL